MTERKLPPAIVLAVAVAAAGWAGPLVRLSGAPALAVAAWRLVFSLAVVALIVLVRRGGAVPPRGREWGIAVAAGVALAAHFWTWIASVSLTTVSSSVALVSMAPIFVAVLSTTLLGERPAPAQWIGIAVAVAGSVVIGWGDHGRGRDPLVGDLLALAGALFVSIYYIVGRRLRQRLDLWIYIGVVYGVAAVVLLAAVAASAEVALTGYPSRDWAIFLALAAVPTMLGHTGANYALRYVRAYVVNLVLLGEPVIATLLAWGLPSIREAPPPQTVAGGSLIVAGIVLGVVARRGAKSHVAAPRAEAIIESEDGSGSTG